MTALLELRRFFGSGRHALWIIAFLMTASAAIRFGAGPGQALALEMQALNKDGDTQPVEETCTTSEEFSGILDTVLRREAAATKLEHDLAVRQRTIELAEEEIRGNLTKLEEAEARLSRTIAQAETASEDDLARLTSVYESMKPKDSAILFQEMPPSFAAGFIARMRADSAAAVMAGLSPEAAYSISVVLAGRNAGTPTE